MDQAVAFRTRSKVAASQQSITNLKALEGQSTITTERPTGPATVQTHIQPEISATQIINQHQSTEIIQAILHSSISSIAWTRGLFNDSCFFEKHIDVAEIQRNCPNVIVEGSQESIPQETHGVGGKRRGTKVMALRKGYSTKVDILLNILQSGIFDALRRNWLRAIQLVISGRPGKPLHALESYTFTFCYENIGPDKSLTGWNLQGPSGEPITMKTAQFALQNFMRKLIAMCHTLPELPDQRFLDIFLRYTEDCDPTYQPTGFRHCVDDEDLWLLFPTTDQWSKATQDVAQLSTGLHSVNMRLSYLKDHKTKDPEAMIPNDIEHNSKIPIHDDITPASEFLKLSYRLPTKNPGISIASENQTDTNTQPPSRDEERDRESSQSSRELGDSIQNEPRVSDPPEFGRNELPANSQLKPNTSTSEKFESAVDRSAPAEPETQLSEDLRFRNKLEQLLKPSSQLSGELTQQLSSKGSQDNSDIIRGSVLKLSATKLTELENLRKKRNIAQRIESVQSKFFSHEVVDCQCRYNEEENDMTYCQFCNTWQHLICYGFRGPTDPRIPTIHACYKCLLYEKESPVLTKMEDLAMLRKGMHIIEHEGYENDKKFTEALHCQLQVATGVLKHLKEKGFLIRDDVSKKASRNKSQARLSAVKTGSLRLAMLQEYFDPLVNVAHHYETPADSLQMPSIHFEVPTQPLPAFSDVKAFKLRTGREKTQTDIHETRPERETILTDLDPNSVINDEPCQSPKVVSREINGSKKLPSQMSRPTQFHVVCETPARKSTFQRDHPISTVTKPNAISSRRSTKRVNDDEHAQSEECSPQNKKRLRSGRSEHQISFDSSPATKET